MDKETTGYISPFASGWTRTLYEGSKTEGSATGEDPGIATRPTRGEDTAKTNYTDSFLPGERETKIADISRET